MHQKRNRLTRIAYAQNEPMKNKNCPEKKQYNFEIISTKPNEDEKNVEEKKLYFDNKIYKMKSGEAQFDE